MYRLHRHAVFTLFGIGLMLFGARTAEAQIVVDFEDLPLASESYYNGSTGAIGFRSEGAFFNNRYNATFGSWSGWSYSNTTDVQTPGFMNQYSAYNLPGGGGSGGSANFGIAYNFNFGDAFIALPSGTNPVSVDITNNTYAALSMRFGDQFARMFGGPDGTIPDWFLLTVIGLDNDGIETGSVDFYLADYRFMDPNLNYIVSNWTTVDLTPLGDATILAFQLASTDNDPVFGMNTPAYFAIDNLVVQ